MIAREVEMDDIQEFLSSRNKRNDEFKNSQKLWKHEQGLHKSQSEVVPVLKGRSGQELLSGTKKVFQTEN